MRLRAISSPCSSLGYLPPVNTHAARSASARTSSPPTPPSCCAARSASSCSSGSIVDPGDPLPAELPVHERHDEDPARELRRAVPRGRASSYPLDADDLVVDIGSNDGTLLEQLPRRRAPRAAASSRPTPPRSPSSAASPRTIAFFNAESAAKRRGQARHGEGRHRDQRLRAHRGRPRASSTAIARAARPTTASSSPSRTTCCRCSRRCSTTRSTTSTCATTRSTSLKYLLEHARPGGHPRQADPDARRLDPRLRRPQGQAPGRTRASRPSWRRRARELVARRDSTTFRRGRAVQARAARAAARTSRRKGKRVYGIGAPSRASTLINYVGLDDGIIDCVLEIKGSYKIGKYIPGTLIPVRRREASCSTDQPEYALLFSWHIADELMPKLKKQRLQGRVHRAAPDPAHRPERQRDLTGVVAGSGRPSPPPDPPGPGLARGRIRWLAHGSADCASGPPNQASAGSGGFSEFTYRVC